MLLSAAALPVIVPQQCIGEPLVHHGVTMPCSCSACPLALAVSPRARALFPILVLALQEAGKGRVPEDIAEGNKARQFAVRDSHGLTDSQRDAVDTVSAAIKALQVSLLQDCE